MYSQSVHPHFNMYARPQPPDPCVLISNGEVSSASVIIQRRRRDSDSPQEIPIAQHRHDIEMSSPPFLGRYSQLPPSPYQQPAVRLTPKMVMTPLKNIQVPHIQVKPIGAGYHPEPPKVHQTPPKYQPSAPPVASHTTALPANTRPNYKGMNQQEMAESRDAFAAQFRILRQRFPDWKIEVPPDSCSLDQIHDIYEGYVKDILISSDCNQWKIYLVLMFLAVETLAIKFLGLDMHGFTAAQVKIMNRYDQILVELGERHYVQGGSGWSPEAKLIMTAAVNCLVFVLIKFFARSIGGDMMVSDIQAMVDNLIGGGNQGAPEKDRFGVPVIPEAAGGIPELLGKFVGKDLNIPSMIANFGNKFTGGIKPGAGDAPKSKPKKKMRANFGG